MYSIVIRAPIPRPFVLSVDSRESIFHLRCQQTGKKSHATFDSLYWPFCTKRRSKGELRTPPFPSFSFSTLMSFLARFRPLIGVLFSKANLEQGRSLREERDPFRLRQCHFNDENSNSFCNKTQTKWHFFPSCILFSTEIPAHAVKLSKRSSKTFLSTSPHK